MIPISYHLIIEFEDWKNKIEENLCNYTKLTGSKGEYEHYQCNRGGVYMPTGTGKRCMKSQGKMMVSANNFYLYHIHCSYKSII